MLTIQSKDTRPKDLGKSRIDFDEKAVRRIYNTFSSWGSPFNNRESLIQICSGVEATSEVKKDLMEAYRKGESCMEEFTANRIVAENIPFYNVIKKLRLKTFKDLCVKKAR